MNNRYFVAFWCVFALEGVPCVARRHGCEVRVAYI